MKKVILIILGILILSFAAFVIYGFIVMPPEGAPVINGVSFQTQYPLGSTMIGTIDFGSYDKNVVGLVIKHLESTDKVNNVDLRPLGTEGDISGSITNTINAGDERNVITESFTVVDSNGRTSRPFPVRILYGDLSKVVNTYTQNIQRKNTSTSPKKLNFIIVKDTDTEFGDQSTSTSSGVVENVIANQIIPKINGIWSQCDVGFTLGKILYEDSKTLKTVNGRSFNSMFSRLNGEGVISVKSDQKSDALWIDDIRQQIGLSKDDYVVYIIGNRIINTSSGKPESGFASNKSVVIPWKYLPVQNPKTDEWFVPETLVSILAHEIGHNLGLLHPSESQISTSRYTDSNLMDVSEAIPVSNLIKEQCNMLIL
ncbi:MAG: hypothetical protein WCS89_03615 [Candidatus Paceibacterota bacterium]|jgi:hypothetical protein